MNSFKRLLRQQDGTSLIELALLVPVMTVMLVGVCDFGVLLEENMRVADSARAAAQYGSLRAHTTDLTGIQNVAKASSAGIPGYAVTAVNYCTCASGAAVTCGDYSVCGTYGLPNVYVKVTATANLPVIWAMRGIPANFAVQSVAIARTTWTGGT